VTEIVVNGSLKDFINKVELIRWKVVKRWVRQILRGLHYLHTRDTPIIHR
jgi:WNK lysine deficient protein kinase